MPFAEFEEKEYEIPLYLELADGSPFVWCPGQVLESSLGLDGTLFTKNSTLWKILSRRGYSLPGIDLNSIVINTPLTRQLPTFRCNLMLQVKRPQHLQRKVRGYELEVPYYRIEIEETQQKTLEKLAEQVRKRAFVGYASATFHKRIDLINNTINSKLVSTSTFIKVTRLKGHGHWAYFEPGTSGQALSEPEYIEEQPLDIELEQLVLEDYRWKFERDFEKNATEHLNELAETLLMVCRESEDDLASYFVYLANEMQSSWDKKYPSMLYPFSIIQLFCSTYGLLWFVVG